MDGNKLVLDNAGEYHVIYRAESTRYTTSFGNPTYAEKDVKIISCIGGGDSLAKLYDTNGALPEGTMLLASRIESDSTVYKAAAEKMAIVDRFQVFGVELVTADGSEAKANRSVTIGIKADFTYNRNQVAAYLLDEDGGLTKLNVSNGGSYVNVETDKSGTIILCIPGVAFHMPIWGYILILVGCLIVAAGVTVAVVFAVKRRKKKSGGAEL